MNWCAGLLPNLSLIERALPNWQREGIWGAILATAVYALVWDLFQYWTHRFEHKFNALWIFHRAHHSDAEMNSSTSLRQSVGGAMIGFLFTHIPTAIICGGNMVPYLGAMVLFSGWGYFNHANLRFSLEPITRILSGPQWHRLHHGKDSRYHNSNYAAFFPFLDLIFGTLQIPKKDEWVETGLQDDTLSRRPFVQAFFPWRNELPETSSRSSLVMTGETESQTPN
ncbi:MAG: sterol desaturase family protein [Pseudomonas sp.]|nr:sterol desaturase family protein [Pseudomonas sp.]